MAACGGGGEGGASRAAGLGWLQQTNKQTNKPNTHGHTHSPSHTNRPGRCVWDDRSGMYGDRRPYTLHYYLEDDTVEINEVGWRGGFEAGKAVQPRSDHLV